MCGAATEDSSSGTGSGSSMWLTITKPLSILLEIINTFILKYIVSSNQAPPPPMLPVSSPAPSQQRPDVNDLHAIRKIMQEQEIGRAIITLAIPIAAALMISDKGGKLMVAHVLTMALMMGCTAIWNGILFRTNFPRLANVLEQVGVSLVLLSLYGLVASFLPIEFSWIIWLSGALSLVPFIVAQFYST